MYSLKQSSLLTFLTSGLTILAAPQVTPPPPIPSIAVPQPHPVPTLPVPQPLPLPTAPNPGLIPTPRPNPNPHNDDDDDDNQPQDEPSTTTTTPATNPCLTSLSALLSGFPSPSSSENPLFPPWASSSPPPILIISSALSSNQSFSPELGLGDSTDEMCFSAVAAITPSPTELAAAYSAYLDDVQMWRFAVEGEAYRLAEKCGGGVGLGLELMMATEGPMCTSGIRESVKPWATGGVEGGLGVSAGVGGGEKMRWGVMGGMLGLVAVGMVML